MPLKSQDRWTLVQVKIERAKKHLLELEAEIASNRNDSLTVVVGEPMAMVNIPQMPFNILPTAGDIVHNLRSSLDHLAYQLVIVGSGQEPSRRVEFPIAKDASTYEAEKAKKVEGMRPDAVNAIDALKPYKGGNDSLWRIHELDNIDKHRALFSVAHDYLFKADWLPGGGRTYLIRVNAPQFPGVFDPQVEQDVQFEIDDAISSPKIGQGKALLPSLHLLVNFVENLVANFTPLLE